MKKKYTVTGMTCSACSARVEKCVSIIDGVSLASVNLISGSLSVESDVDLTAEIVKAVKAEGYGIKEGAGIVRDDKSADKLRLRLILSVPLVVILMYISMGHMVGLPLPAFIHNSPLIFTALQAGIALPVMIINGKYYTVGFKKLFTLAPNMDSLVALGSFASFAYGVFALVMISIGKNVELYRKNLYFEGAAMIVTLITVGKFLEEKSKKKTMSAVEKLIGLTPDSATVLIGETEKIIPVSELKKGDKVVLKSGDSVACDGVIISGGGFSDESLITGESMPVYKGVGDKVIGGSVFTGGYAVFTAESVGEDATLYKIVKLVEEANSTKVPIARLADKIAGVFVPVVIGVSLSAFLVWLLLIKAGYEFSINIAVSVLVVSCPCALGLATPAALMAGTGKAAERGILIKSGAALQALAGVDFALLDKTGTITYGKPEISVYEHIGGLSDKEFIGVCASVEKKSSHPISLPIIKEAEKLGCEDLAVVDFESVAGLGVKAVVDGKTVVIGNEELLLNSGADISSFKSGVDSEEKGGATVVYCAIDGKTCGYISIKDQIKPSSIAAIEAFKAMGVEVEMLTGDGEAAAKAVGEALGIKYKAKVLPEDKHREVKERTLAGKRVLMIGDGVNDAPALTEASVGMAIGAGTDIAIESADVVLINGELSCAVEAIRLGRAVMRNIKENLFWAFFYNATLIPIACGALYMPLKLTLSPMLASLAMSLSSIFVVGNALRLRLFKYKLYNREGEEDMFGKKSKTVVTVEGMMCEHCKKRVETALSVYGKTKVDLNAKTATIFNCNAQDADIEKTITEIGYKAGKIVKE